MPARASASRSATGPGCSDETHVPDRSSRVCGACRRDARGGIVERRRERRPGAFEGALAGSDGSTHGERDRPLGQRLVERSIGRRAADGLHRQALRRLEPEPDGRQRLRRDRKRYELHRIRGAGRDLDLQGHARPRQLARRREPRLVGHRRPAVADVDAGNRDQLPERPERPARRFVPGRRSPTGSTTPPPAPSSAARRRPRRSPPTGTPASRSRSLPGPRTAPTRFTRSAAAAIRRRCRSPSTRHG